MSDDRDWFLAEWMQHEGKRQADLVKDRGWPKGRVNKFFHGAHPYRREIVNELATWLRIEPYELLMPPADALRLRRLRDAALDVAEGAGQVSTPIPKRRRASPARDGSQS